MTDSRFADEPLSLAEKLNPSAFLVIPAATDSAAPASPMQWLYQKLYEQAQFANQQPRPRELFAVMN